MSSRLGSSFSAAAGKSLHEIKRCLAFWGNEVLKKKNSFLSLLSRSLWFPFFFSYVSESLNDGIFI